MSKRPVPASPAIAKLYAGIDNAQALDRTLARVTRSILAGAPYDPVARLDDSTIVVEMANAYERARHLQAHVRAYENRLQEIHAENMRRGARALDEYRKTRDTLDGAIARHPAGKQLQ